MIVFSCPFSEEIFFSPYLWSVFLLPPLLHMPIAPCAVAVAVAHHLWHSRSVKSVADADPSTHSHLEPNPEIFRSCSHFFCPSTRFLYSSTFSFSQDIKIFEILWLHKLLCCLDLIHSLSRVSNTFPWTCFVKWKRN